MKDINVKVSDGNVLELSTTPLILKKNESYRLNFDLTGWDGNTPVCRFRDAAGHFVDKELDSNNSCVVPALTALITYVGLYSYDGVHSSTLIRLNSLESTLSQLDGTSELLTDEEIKMLKDLSAADFSDVLNLESKVNAIMETLSSMDYVDDDELSDALSHYVTLSGISDYISVYVAENADTLKGEKGERGYSAFEIAQQNDSSIESVDEWLASLKGEKGADGANGSSVTVNIDDNTAGQHTVMFTDSRGNHSTIIYDGKDGKDGEDGAAGRNGISPTVSIDDTTAGQHTVTISDVDADHEFTVYDGTNGVDGTTPVKGIDYFTSAEIALIEDTVLANVISAFETEVLNSEY